MPKLTLALFGSLQITLDGEPITARLWAKPQALLAYLAVQADVPHRREHLAGLLWPEQSDDAARTSLRQALRQLNQAFGDDRAPFLSVTPQTIQFNTTSDSQLDVTEFAALMRACDQHPHRLRETCRACVERLQRATALYRGDLLAGFFLKDSTTFEEWALVRREQLRHQAIAALSTLTEYHARRGEYGLMEQAARRQIEIDPLYEDAHRQVMRALTWRGQRNAALAQYENLRKTLVEEIGAPPEKETLALSEQICDDALAPPTPAPLRNWPLHLTSFIGRETELAQIADCIQVPDARLITLTGTGGVGKTRLALQTVAREVSAFRDGACFVSLAAVSAPDLIAPTIASALHVTLSGTTDPKEQLFKYLRDTQPDLLLLLDNFEQLVEAAPLLLEWLAVDPNLKILVTSREWLRVRGERQIRVAPLVLPDPDQLSIADWSHYSAIALFADRARAALPDFALTAENARTIAEICNRLDGLPLAIELAAARVGLLSLRDLQAKLARRLELLTEGARDLPARQQTLRATIAWSYELLDRAEQALLARLAVFVGGCTLEAIEVVCGEAASSAMLDRLSALVAKSMLQRVENVRGEPRFIMLETIREYALEQLNARGEVDAIQRKHLAYYTTMAEMIEPKLWGAGFEACAARLEEELGNLRAALAWSLEPNDAPRSDVEMGARLAGSLWFYLNYRGYLKEGRQWLERAVIRMREPGKTRAKVLLSAGWLTWQQGDYTIARVYAEESIALWRGLDSAERTGLAEALHMFGHLTFDQRNYDQARALYEESLALYHDLQNQEISSALISDLGMVAYHQNDYTTARSRFEESLTLYQKQGNTSYIAENLNRLGDLARLEGDYARATELYEESLARLRQIKDHLGTASGFHKLGYVAQHRRDYPTAQKVFTESLTQQQKLGNKQGIAECLAGLAGLAVALEEPERAVRLFGAARALLDAIGAPLAPADRAEWERDERIARAQLDGATFNAAWAKGQKMTLDKAIDYALENPNSTVIASREAAKQSPSNSETLAPRASAGVTQGRI